MEAFLVPLELSRNELFFKAVHVIDALSMCLRQSNLFFSSSIFMSILYKIKVLNDVSSSYLYSFVKQNPSYFFIKSREPQIKLMESNYKVHSQLNLV
jgi:hypothetical protein